MAIELRIPPLGESVSEGVIARWLKSSGDHVAADEVVLELETDKAAMEVRAPAAGTLEVLRPAGATVPVGELVARVAEGAAPAAKAPTAEAPKAEPPKAPAPKAEPPKAPAPKAPAPKAEPPKAAAVVSANGGPRPSPPSPSLRRWAREHGVDPSAARAPAAPPAKAPSPLPGDADAKREPMSNLRKRIAERLVEAQRTAAILTTFNEVDLSEVLALRKRYRERFKEIHGVDLGFMSIFGRATISALADVPKLNAMIDGTDIVTHSRVHLGVAVSTERGLVVPVVKNADLLGIAELEREIGALAGLAKNNKLTPDHLGGGTFTISNGGVFGSLLSTPILNPPQSGILGMHKIQERPVVVDGQIVIRPMMYLALSYDHRLIDGREAVTFLVRVKERLEDPARLLLEV